MSPNKATRCRLQRCSSATKVCMAKTKIFFALILQMECSICEQKFSAGERRPKVLPCGHSYCLPCVRQLPNKECPVDKKVSGVDFG